MLVAVAAHFLPLLSYLKECFMRAIFRSVVLFSFCNLLLASASGQWKPAGDKVKTSWAEKITPETVWQEYPRPLLERADWVNLNGLWSYAIVNPGVVPDTYEGSILVPFAVESSLSGVQKTVGKEKRLWYKRTFTVPSNWKGKRVLLHFGAVDWQSEVFVNGIKVGGHTGGYTPFSFDITSCLQKGAQTLVVSVFDPSNDGFQPRGKQVKNPGGIFYTPVTGIWQTVWLEPVSDSYLEGVVSVPDIDQRTIRVEPKVKGTADFLLVQVKEEGKVVAEARTVPGEPITLPVPSPKLWSPESPFLYTMDLTLFRSGVAIDKVSSYFGMRKISVGTDKAGIQRMFLNNKPYFHYGPLDQGWWPDGLYTAPCDEALAFDIVKTKELGFNMIRKHVKVEPARWYYHADKLGVLVWQDMPSGDNSPAWISQRYFDGLEFHRSPESEANFRREWKEIMDLCYSNPSVVVWVPFNEAWGQFKTVEITEWTMQYDRSRLVNSASGGNFYPTGHIVDLHNYPGPAMYLFDAKRVNVLGEYGGIGLAKEGHLWAADRNWGYVQFKSEKEVTDEYLKYARQLHDFVKRGFSGAVYTQTTDVEVEINGLMTYDRKLMKVDTEAVRKANLEVIQSML